MSKLKLTRREMISLALVQGGGLGLRSLLTGLPVHFLTSRSVAETKANYLVFASNRAGDPVNCNVPGTYKSGYEHSGAYSNPANIRFGTEMHKAAPVWNNLRSEIRAFANFFHLRSGTNGHNELNSVMKIFGAIESIKGKGGEMLSSRISYELSKMMSTQLQSPIALGSTLSFKGENQKIYSPGGIKALFPSGTNEALLNARKFRDRKIDTIYRELKVSGTPAQKKFIDSHIISGSKARLLGDQLSSALEDVSSNSADDKMKTAAALLALNVTPAVTMDLPFGGDNHADSGLVREMAQHESSIQALNNLYTYLKNYGIEGKTHFSLLNVFGRTPTINGKGGRDHWGRHTVMFSFGPKIKGGVVGDIAPSGRGGRYESMAINSQTGKVQNPDINPEDTLKSAAKSLMAVSGISESRINEVVTGGKIVKGYLK